MNKKATIIHHQGFGDLFTSNPVCNYYSNLYKELTIFVLDESRKIVVEEMYKHKDNIKCVIPKFINQNKYNSSCLICMQSDRYSCRNDSRFNSHIFVDYSECSDCDNIKIGCFKENYELWKSFLHKNMGDNVSFSHSFYLFENLDLKVRETEFSVYRDNNSENKKYELLPEKDYIVLHDDSQRGLNINKSKIPNDIYIHQLNGSSKTMVDQIKILENAKEIHFIDSSYSVLIYFLSLTNKKIKQIPKYFHYYANPREGYTIYENPIPENWQILR